MRGSGSAPADERVAEGRPSMAWLQNLLDPPDRAAKHQARPQARTADDQVNERRLAEYVGGAARPADSRPGSHNADPSTQRGRRRAALLDLWDAAPARAIVAVA